MEINKFLNDYINKLSLNDKKTLSEKILYSHLWEGNPTHPFSRGKDYVVSNAVFGLGNYGNWSVEAAQTGSANAWLIQGGSNFKSLFWNLYAQNTDANYYLGNPYSVSDRYGELGLHVTPRLDLSLIGRMTNNPISNEKYSYIKPAINWRATDSFSVDARPSYDGSYVYNMYWNINRNNRASLSRYNDFTQLDLSHNFENNTQLSFGLTQDPFLGKKYYQTLSGTLAVSHPVNWAVGLMEGGDKLGYLLDGSMMASSGVSVHMQAYKDPLITGVNGGVIFQLSVVANFNVTPSGLVGSGYSYLFTRKGAISGKIVGSLPENVKWSDLKGSTILVDNRPIGFLDGYGHYLIENLSPGTYRLKLDPDNLPIEMKVSEISPLVQVKSGATTKADFSVSLSLGIAGKVTSSSGKTIANKLITATNVASHAMATTKVDSLGFYRIDNLSPGSYLIETDNLKKNVEIKNTFVFGENFQVD